MTITETPEPITLASFAAAVAKYKDSELTNARFTGDFVRDYACTYVVRCSDGSPIEGHRHCIAGQALADLGHLVPERWEGVSFGNLIRDAAIPVAGDASEIALLRELGDSLQGKADCGGTWGECIAEVLTPGKRTCGPEAAQALADAIVALPHADMQEGERC